MKITAHREVTVLRVKIGFLKLYPQDYNRFISFSNLLRDINSSFLI